MLNFEYMCDDTTHGQLRKGWVSIHMWPENCSFIDL